MIRNSIVLLIALFFCATASAQTSGNTSGFKLDSLGKILIVPVQLSVLDTSKVTSIKISSIADDMLASAEFYIALYDSRNRKVADKNMKIDGADYANWDHKLLFIANKFCNRYGLQLQ